MTRVPLLSVAGLVVAAAIACTPAHAVFRAYLASDGNDANPCTLLQPCRLLPAALGAVDPGGEIWMLDSANYNTGPVNVTKSVSILAIPGAIGSIVATGDPSNNGLVIATAGVKVSLRNLVFIMLGIGHYGVYFTAGAELTVQDCEFANLDNGFEGGGIWANVADAKVTLRDTTLRNSRYGLYLFTGRALLERVRALNNSSGIVVAEAFAAISDSVISGNAASGISVGASFVADAHATLSNSDVSGNAVGVALAAGTGFSASAVVSGSTLAHNTNRAFHLAESVSGVAELVLDGNVIANNANAVVINSGTPTVYSRGNNTLRHNSGPGGDTLTATTLTGQ